MFRLFENLHGEVSSTGADFQHFVCLFQIYLDRVITMRNSELLGHSFRKTNHVNYPSINTPRSRNRCIPLAGLGLLRMCWPKRAVLIGLVTCALSDVDLLVPFLGAD